MTTRLSPVRSVALALLTVSCVPALKPDPHYALGDPYKAGSHWYYPKESFDLEETGLASIARGDATRLTTDGEVFDQTALAAAHPTVQLPAIARLTNLENGREVTVRLNDRGSGDPRRLIEVTRRTALLLDIPPGADPDRAAGAALLCPTGRRRGTGSRPVPPPAPRRQSVRSSWNPNTLSAPCRVWP